jgi:hypothetical protein
MIHPGVIERLANFPNVSDDEVLATFSLIGGEQYLPHHMLSQFVQVPSYPAMKLVRRIQALAKKSPEFANRAKPLLDNLDEFFPIPPWPIMQTALLEVTKKVKYEP